MSWPEDLTKTTAKELATLHLTNEAWSKELKLRIKRLMNGKAAGDIGKDEHASSLNATNKDTVECIRRRQLLTHELSKRGVE
jgi:hypothetical protein